MSKLNSFSSFTFNTLIILFILAVNLYAADWSTTELQFQYGNLTVPGTIGRGDAETSILTYQHASGWKYGDNFFFVDFLDDSFTDDFNDSDYYSELYVNLSLGKILDRSLAIGPIKDVGIIGGLNMAGDASVRKYLPGIRLSLDLPGFAFLN